MNDLMNRLLLAGDRFMREMHLEQPRFSYSTCGSFNQGQERKQK